MTAKTNEPTLCGPCDGCCAPVEYGKPGGRPFDLLCEKCAAEMDAASKMFAVVGAADRLASAAAVFVRDGLCSAGPDAVLRLCKDGLALGTCCCTGAHRCELPPAKPTDASPRVETDDDRFGLCPVCHKTDGFINIGRGHWFYCKEHKAKWFIGSNRFSSWKDETEPEQRRIFDELGAGAFEDVKPYYLPTERLIAALRDEINDDGAGTDRDVCSRLIRECRADAFDDEAPL